MEQVHDLIVKHRKVVFNNRPDSIYINLEVVMNQYISHSYPAIFLCRLSYRNSFPKHAVSNARS